MKDAIYKVCSCCKEEKTFDQFYENKSKREGINSSCKDCEKIKHLKRYLENPEKVKSRVAKRRKENPEKAKDAVTKWRNENPEKIKLATKEQISSLCDSYIVQQIEQQIGLSREIIKKHPELIESKRLSVKFKRLLKHKKDENTKTS